MRVFMAGTAWAYGSKLTITAGGLVGTVADEALVR